MPEYLTPAVYVEETSFRSRSIEGVATSTAGIAGFTRYGPVPHELPFETTPPGRPAPPPAVKEPPLITSYGEFERAFGGLADVAGGPNYTALAARAFFDNGGRRLYVARVFGWPRDANGDIDFARDCSRRAPCPLAGPTSPSGGRGGPVWRASGSRSSSGCAGARTSSCRRRTPRERRPCG